MRTLRRGWVAVITLVVLTLGLVAMAVAQPPAGDQGRGPGRMPGMMGGPPPMMGGTAITATISGVYVVTAGTVYKLDPATLKQLAEADLPRPEPPER